MAMSNHERVGRGLEHLRAGLLPFVARELEAHYGNRLEATVTAALPGMVGAEARRSGEWSSLDVQALLTLTWNTWNEAFQAKLGHPGRSLVSELRDVRNRWAHQQAFTTEDAYRALDSITRLLKAIGAEEARTTEQMGRELLRIRFDEETRRSLNRSEETPTATGVMGGLKPWREVITPHQDVREGRYLTAEFAADLAQVAQGTADDEYQDPTEFFRRTYLTGGLTRLLQLAVERLTNAGGNPVVQLQTTFGGGKTHAMLALYHLFGGGVRFHEVPHLTEALGMDPATIPTAARAVFVGTDFSAGTPRIHEDGTVVRTMWGEIAYGLGGREGFDMVAEADRQAVAPGAEVLTALFNRYAPAIIFIDEWVAFARNLYGHALLSAGSFDGNLTFAQSLTEAAKRAERTLVVASIPASQNEIGGEGGQVALEQLSHVFGRLESVWAPAAAEESFEIVRRRLFTEVLDYPARDQVIAAFMRMYREHSGDFPRESGDSVYEQQLKAAYPIHPELFKRLYEDWSTLDRFQRTRGVLRLMAGVIHTLWEHEDRSLLIMPGSVPLDNPTVKNELLQYLPEGWEPVVSTDVDGSGSRPLQVDRENPSFGRYSASRRVTRTIFLGSAPSVADQRVRGIEKDRIKLGCVQPGETAATFGDALHRLEEHLTYLYADPTRAWFDTHPSVRREAEDRARNLSAGDVAEEILRRLRAHHQRGNFAGVHVGVSHGDIPDDQAVRLVVLEPSAVHQARDTGSPAIRQAQEILDKRGTAPRHYKNMVVYLAADKAQMVELDRLVRQYLAWDSIVRDKDVLNLDMFQWRQAESSRDRVETAVTSQVRSTYIWGLVPTQSDGTSAMTWEDVRVRQGDESPFVRVSKQLENDGHLTVQWSPALLQHELERWIWPDRPHVALHELWDFYGRYCYFTRLKSVDVLLKAIQQGLESRDFFALARDVSANGRYQGLVWNRATSVTMDTVSVLVRADVAKAWTEEEAGANRTAAGGETISAGTTELDRRHDGADGSSGTLGRTTDVNASFRRFHGAIQIGPTSLATDVARVSSEVVQHLVSILGASVEVTVEITAQVPTGVPDDVVRTVTENCRTLKFREHGFEET